MTLPAWVGPLASSCVAAARAATVGHLVTQRKKYSHTRSTCDEQAHLRREEEKTTHRTIVAAGAGHRIPIVTARLRLLQHHLAHPHPIREVLPCEALRGPLPRALRPRGCGGAGEEAGGRALAPGQAAVDAVVPRDELLSVSGGGHFSWAHFVLFAAASLW